MDRCAILVDAGYLYAEGGKLCCGTRGRGHQALIYRDLMTLAQHRAISDAVLISGDGDLCEGGRAAQDHGVRVVLVGIECAKGHNQSEELVLDADHLVVLRKPQLEPMFTPRSSVATGHAPRLQGQGQDKSVAGTSASGAAAVFAREWLDKATKAEIADLNSKRPNIPRPVDIELLTAVEKTLQRSLKDDEVSRRDTRSAFWGVIGGTMGKHPDLIHSEITGEFSPAVLASTLRARDHPSVFRGG